MSAPQGYDPQSRSWAPVTSQLHLFPDSVAPDGVVYQFQGNMNDSSGNARHLSIINGTERYRQLADGVRGFHFDGLTRLRATAPELITTGAVTFGAIVRFDKMTTALAETAWIYAMAGAGASEANVNNCLHGVLLQSQTTRWFQEATDGDNHSYSVASRPQPFAPCVLMATRTAGNVIQFYLNGQPYGPASSALTAAVDGASARLNVGNDDQAVGSATGQFVMASMFIRPTAIDAATALALANGVLGSYYGEES